MTAEKKLPPFFVVFDSKNKSRVEDVMVSL